LSLLQFQIDHFYFLLLLPNLLLTVFEYVFLYVRLLIQDAKLVIAVDQLNTHVVTTFACLLVLINQIVHFLLQRVNYQVQLVRLVDLLIDDRLLLPKLVLVLVQLRTAGIALLSLLLHLVLHLKQCVVFFS
jgi:hypothetical protein